MKRTIILGWDGATFKVLDRMMHLGLMPNLSGLVSRGVRANLLSTMPPITGPAWSSFRTGRKPENHGVFSFLKTPGDCLDVKYIERHNAASISGIRFWNIMNVNGYKTIIVDLPMSDPVEEIDGVMVSGMMTRGKRGVLTYPAELKDELLNALPGYFGKSLTDGIDVSGRYLDRLIQSLEEKLTLDKYLLQNKEWQVFFTVYSAVDTLQHYFWRFLDPTQINYVKNKSIWKKIAQFFSRLDTSIAEYSRFLSTEDFLFIVSDHGFYANNYIFYVNNFLLENELLSIKKQRMAGRFNTMQVKKIVRALDVFKLRTVLKKETKQKLGKMLASPAIIDWDKTNAFFRTNNEYGIYINRKETYTCGTVSNEYYEKLVDLLIGKLKGARNPFDGSAIFNKVSYKRELYKNGRFTNDAPDIMLDPADGVSLGGFGLRHRDQFLVKNEGFLTGFHHRVGIFVGTGRGLKSNYRAESFHIYDFAPLVLFLHGLPIDSRMDGEFQAQLFDDAGASKNFNRVTYSLQPKFPDGAVTTDNSVEPLRSLGYID